MARPVKRHLKIGATPHLDEEELIVRMHENDIPAGIRWGNYIRLSANKKHVACKLQSNAMAEIKAPRVHQISINKHLKNKLGVKPGATVDFYISKASFLKAPYYTMRYHPSSGARKRAFWKTFGTFTAVAIVVTLVVLYFLLWS